MFNSLICLCWANRAQIYDFFLILKLSAVYFLLFPPATSAKAQEKVGFFLYICNTFVTMMTKKITDTVRRTAVLLAAWMLTGLAASAQSDRNLWQKANDFLDSRDAKAMAKMDTSYVGSYPYHWDARLFAKTVGYRFVSSAMDAVELTTGMRNRVGVGLSYRGFGLSFSKAIGKKLNLDLGVESYGKHLGIEYALRATDRLAGTMTLPDGEKANVQDGDLILISNKLNLFYSFNPRFSYAAAMKQSMIQRRSAGSWIAGVSWSFWDILFRDGQEQYGFGNYFYQRFSVGAGYGYNLVLGRQHWLLHASVVPMWTFYDMESLRSGGTRVRTKYPFGKISFSGTARAGVYYRWKERWSIGLSGVVNQSVTKKHFSSKAADYSRVGAQEWQATLSLSCRF
jgi:hypothetical protein